MFFSFHTVFASEPKYPVGVIPSELRENVNVVIREYHTSYTIHAQDRATMHVHEVFTIFNENGKHFATEVLGYDKLSKVSLFKGTSYDANGEVIKKLKSNEIYDQSAFDGFSLYSDNRLKAAELTNGSYPYTVEFEYEVEFKYLFMIPGFTIIPGEEVSVQQSSFELSSPASLVPKFKVCNFESTPSQKTLKDGSKKLTWSFSNLKPIKFESAGPSVQELIPQILVAPVRFEFDGYKGSTETWDDLGKWIISLNKDRNQLPEETKNKVREIASKFTTSEEKIKAIYEYMQSRTRYVSIQLGIGGFQPFEASVVDKTGYGDCKALSNYMVSMLEVVGIKANYTLIRAGKNAPLMNESFPSSQFNHAVVSVPNNGDTLWLECTSQTNPFGYMGTFTGDRRALAITDNGAKIVSTPVYEADDNVQSRLVDVTVAMDGNAKASVTTHYSGLKYESDGLSFILNDQFDLQKKWLLRTTKIPSFEVSSFKFQNQKSRIPTAIVTAVLNLKRLATVSGKRLMLTPNLMNRSTFIPEHIENRKTEIVQTESYIDFDTVKYHIPDQIYAEFLPDTVKITSRFGEYESSYKLDQGLVVYTRKFRVNKGRFPATMYKEFTDFYKSVNKADNAKLVFLNKT